MAVVALKTAAITAFDTPGSAAPNAFVAKAPMFGSVGVIELANGDSIGSTYRMVRVPSNARIVRVAICCDAITSGAADIGLYRTAADGGAVVDADFFASAQSIATALLANTDVTHEAGGSGNQNGEIANAEKRLWEVLGLTSDPGIFYDIALTLTAATTAAGTVVLRARWTL